MTTTAVSLFSVPLPFLQVCARSAVTTAQSGHESLRLSFYQINGTNTHTHIPTTHCILTLFSPELNTSPRVADGFDLSAVWRCICGHF